MRKTLPGLAARAHRGLCTALMAAAASGGSSELLAQDAPTSWMAPVPAWAVPDAADERCQPYDGGVPAAAWLSRAWDALAIPEDRILHIHYIDRNLQLMQSDRPYPPYLPAGAGGEIWIDPATGMTRQSSTTIYPSSGRWAGRSDRLYDDRRTWVTRDTLVRPVPQLHPFTLATRALEPISILRDWRRGDDVRVAGMCPYRDDLRVVLERDGRWGAERLYLDRESALPVKTDVLEPHYLWGQVRVEVVWATWWAASGLDRVAPYPVGATRLMDGGVVDDRAVGLRTWIPRAEAPDLGPPGDDDPMDPGDPGRLDSPEPDTVRVSDRAFLLVSPFYTEAVTLQRDTVWLLDATLGEERARQDHEWIRRLFGPDRPIAVVVTDLAWPHVGGVRYWVSRGATIVSHAASEPFLRRIVERRWTLRPDALETAREGSTFKFRPVDGPLPVAAGAVWIHPIGGIGSETAVMVWLPGDRFLWAGDYIQDVEAPTTYAQDVWRAVQRDGLRPARFAAQHHPLTPWSAVEAVVGEDGGG